MDGAVSNHMVKHNAVKIFDKPRMVICVPIGSKIHHNAQVQEDGEIKMGPAVRIPATVPIQWLTAQMQMIHPLNTSVVYLTQHGMYAGEARQVMTMNALRLVQDDGYILYWDDDTLPPQMAMYKMMNYMEQHPEVGILSAVYCTRENPPEPVLYKFPTTGVSWDFTMGPDAMPEEIYSAGAGFMIARVSAIKAAQEKFPGEPLWADMKTSRETPDEAHDPVWGSGMTWGHDIRFCRMIAESGYKVMVDGRVECGHLDIATQVVHFLPENCLPKRRGRKYHGEQYWDNVYGREGAGQMRLYGEMFLKLLGKINQHSKVVEIGCGPGVLGMLLATQGGCMWTGYDQSDVAVDMACSKFLNAYKKSAHEIAAEDLKDADVVVATEAVEHLEPEDSAHIFELVTSLRKRFIFTVPNNCMGPEEQPEHIDLFNEEKVKEITAPFLEKFPDYVLSIEEGDPEHLICVFEPKGKDSGEPRTDSADLRTTAVRSAGSEELQAARAQDKARSPRAKRRNAGAGKISVPGVVPGK